MNVRFTAILLVVLLLAVGGLLVALLIDDDAKPGGALLPSLAGQAADTIDLVELTRTEPAAEKLTFARTAPGTWELREGDQGRLDTVAICKLIDAIVNLKPTPAKDLSTDPAKHGLDKPSFTITLRGDQRSGTLRIGQTTVGGNDAITFVADGDRPNVPVAVKRADLQAVFRESKTKKDGSAAPQARWLADYRQKKLLGIDIPDIVTKAKSLRLESAGKVLAMNRAGTEWRFDAPAGYGTVDVPGDMAANPDVITGLRPLVATLLSAMPTGPDDFLEKPEALSKYGLADGDANRIQIAIEAENGTVDRLTIGNKVEGTSPQQFYAQIPGQRVVMKVFGNRLDALAKTIAVPKAIQDRTLIADSDAAKIDAIDSTIGGVTAKLRKVMIGSEPAWVLYGSGEPQRVPPNVVKALVDELVKPRIAIESGPLPDDQFAGPNLLGEMKVWFGGVVKAASKDAVIPAEPKLEAPSMTFLVGKIEDRSTNLGLGGSPLAQAMPDTAALRRTFADGRRTDFKVPASLGRLAVAPRYNYFALSIPTFPVEQARKLTFNRGAEPFEFDRQDGGKAYANGKWMIAKPDSLKTWIADSGLLMNLATLSPASAVAENPNAAELVAMGLATPRLTATVSFEKDPPRVYHFGSEKDGAYVHVREAGKPVWLVPKVSLDAFLTGDVRDRAMYRTFLPDAVKIRMTGWKQKFGTAKLLEFERKGNDWAAIGTPPFAVNPTALGQVAALMASPAWLNAIGPHKLGYGVVPDGDPLEIVVSNATGDMIKVVLGDDTEGGAAIFAYSTIPDKVFTIPAGLYKPLKDPAYYK